MNVFGQPVEPRVGQLDASLLDAELLSLLKDRLWDGFKVFHPELKSRYERELLLLLRLLLFKTTIWDHSTTYGAKLQNLKLVNARSTYAVQVPMSRRQKTLYGLLTVGGWYLYSKLSEYLSAAAYDSDDVPQVVKLRDVVDKMSVCWTAASLLNFVAFLYSGHYSTLIMRLLRIRYVPVTRKVTRSVNFEFQNRQLVWNALTEFLLFVLPLIKAGKLQRKATKWLWGGQSTAPTLEFLPAKTCAICYQTEAASTNITNPYRADCGDVYCYVCIKLKLEEDSDGWSCLRCARLIKKADPVQEEEREKPA